jgi:hypothetical protein
LIENIKKRCTSKQCVGVLELYGHGNPFGIQFTTDDWLNDKNVTKIGNILREKVRFCEPCLIILNGCNTGNAKDGWVKKLVESTHCTVVGLGGYGNSSFLDGKITPTSKLNKILIKKKDFWGSEYYVTQEADYWGWNYDAKGEKNLRDKTFNSEDDTYRVFDAPAVHLKPVNCNRQDII